MKSVGAPTAPVFDVQRFSIHDGPGIRSLVFFKGCNLACAWCQNPESQHVAPLVSFYAARCEACFRCADVCPDDAILRTDYRVDHARCSFCLKCVAACPHKALRPIGEYLDPAQLFERLLADEAYYVSSGGGVTFSGGEPTLHPAFMDAVLDLCLARGIHTAIETCGTFAYERWRAIFPKLDLIYFDLKIMDDTRHKAATGLGNARVLENAKRLVADGLAVEFRLALVPGYTDTLENLEIIAGFLKSQGQGQIHLLSYHNMGETKIDIIQGPQKKQGLETYPKARLAEVAKWFEAQGIAAHHET